MKKFRKFNIVPVTISKSKHQSSIEIFPLEQGFGITLGNALRRVLLSSISSAAVFALKINSIPHEFTAVDGLFEDVTHVILNIKKLSISVDESLFNVEDLLSQPIEMWEPLKIRKNKAGIITAADIETLPGVTIVNKDLKICELTKDVNFEMDLYITVDKGYKNFMENQESLKTLKIIAIDSLFSPIINVELKVLEEKTTKYGITDKLILTVLTNGSVSAINAISYAAKILTDLLMPIVSINKSILNMNFLGEEKIIEKKIVAANPIDTLGLTMRSFNCLKSNGINTIPELISITKEEAQKIKNLGKKSLNEIIEKLKEKNLYFKS